MANLEFSQKDIEDLARKLSTLQPFLSDQERALLLAIFAAAAGSAKPFGPSGATLPKAGIAGQAAVAGTAAPVTAADLQQQLLGAYVPGNDFGSVTSGLPDTGKITMSPAESPGPPANVTESAAASPAPSESPGTAKTKKDK